MALWDRAAGTGTARRLPLTLIVTLAVVGAFTLRDALSFPALADHRAQLLAFRDTHYLLSVMGFVAAYVAIVALSLPGAAIATLAGGFLFGIFPGTLFNVVAATTGATLLFLAARMGGGARLAARFDAAGGRWHKVHDALKQNEVAVLLLLRLIPLVPFVVANLLPALVGVAPRRFVLTTFVGILPAALAFTAAGAGLGEVFARGEVPDLGLLFAPRLLLPLLALAALAAVPIVLHAVRKGR